MSPTRWRVPRALPLSVRLLLAFVGLVIATTVALSIAAYQSSRQTLVADAFSDVRAVALANERTLTSLLELRQRRLVGFLASVESLCAEPDERREFGWSEDCVRTMMDQMRATEAASGAVLSYRGRVLYASGLPVGPAPVHPDALARVVPQGRADSDLLMQAVRGGAVLRIQFDSADVLPFSTDPWEGSGRTGEVLLSDPDGRFLAAARFGEALGTPPGAGVVEPLRECRAFADERIGPDYRGVETVHGFRPVPAIGGCVDAHIPYSDLLDEAATIRSNLIRQGAYFAIAGALLSLVAAHRISAPVRRLARAAHAIQTGRSDTRIPIGGPAEVQALGRALEAMTSELSTRVTTEQSARREAEIASRSKDRFLALVSHELRTPLNAVLGWTRLLSVGYLSEPRRRRAIDAIERNAQAQQQLVEDLLDVSRIVAGRLRMAHEPVRLQPVVEAAIESVRPAAAEKGIQIDTEVSDGMTVSGDAQRLRQIAGNLLSNAVKFTPPGGSVSVRLRRVRNEAEMVVVDTGAGITPEFMPELFDWFRQRDPKVKREETGLGLGLGLVKQLVELHGGTVTAASAGEGQGATFIVRLPLVDPAGEPPRPS